MNNPELTILIPSLNRAETLKHTLNTVIHDQNYSNYKIIVSDNHSEDNTFEIVKSFNNCKITYIRPERRLPMSKHWEFILNNVQSGYVTILGDDDGLLPFSLNKIAKILKRHKEIQAIGWKFCNFHWKELPNYFSIPLSNHYRIVKSDNEIKKIFARNIGKTIEFPSLYGGFISIDLINKIKMNQSGIFFHSRIPDFFSGGVIATNVNKYIRLEFPITINATSKKSTGFSTIAPQNDQKSFNDLLNNPDNIPFHPSLIFLRHNLIPIAEAMLQVNKLYPTFPKVCLKKMIYEIVNDLGQINSKEELDIMIIGLKKISTMNNINLILPESINSIKKNKKKTERFSPISNIVYIDSQKRKIDTVEDACKFAFKLISPKFHLSHFGIRNKIKCLTNYITIKTKLTYSII